MDVRDPLGVGSVAREIAVTVGPPQVLVNVAGIGVAATVLETSDEDWNRVLASEPDPGRSLEAAGPRCR